MRLSDYIYLAKSSASIRLVVILVLIVFVGRQQFAVIQIIVTVELFGSICLHATPRFRIMFTGPCPLW